MKACEYRISSVWILNESDICMYLWDDTMMITMPQMEEARDYVQLSCTCFTVFYPSLYRWYFQYQKYWLSNFLWGKHLKLSAKWWLLTQLYWPELWNDWPRRYQARCGGHNSWKTRITDMIKVGLRSKTFLFPMAGVD